MYTIYLALASLLASAVVGSNPGIPSCAFSCVTGYGGCGQFDYKCICSNHAYIAHMACCVSKRCDAADQEATLQFANALCAGQNVNNLPQTATCASTASGSSSTGTATSSTGFTSAATTGSGTTTTTSPTAAQASSSSAAASSSSPGAAVMNKMDSLGVGMVMAGLVAVL